MFAEIKTKIQNARVEYILGGIIACLIILIIFISWSGWLFNPPRVSSDLDLRTLPPKSQQDAVARIIASGNLGDCAAAKGINIEGVNYEKVCRNNIALRKARETLDISYCDELDNVSFGVEECKSAVTLAKAIQTGDQAMCDSESDETRSECLLAFWINAAFNKSNIDLCLNVLLEKEQTQCRDQYYIRSLMAEPFSVRCANLSFQLLPYCENYQSVIRSEKSCDEVWDLRLNSACKNWRASHR